MEVNEIKSLFDKYILIWIWSIFVSINTALSYNIFNLYETSKWEMLNAFLIPIYIMAAIMAFASWLSLFKFFKIKILTLILDIDPARERLKDYYENNDIRDEVKKYDRNYFAYRQLNSSFYFIISAIFFRFMIPIVEMMFGLIYR